MHPANTWHRYGLPCAIALIALALGACQRGAAVDDAGHLSATQNTQGLGYRSMLVAAIEQADQIVITEHSYEYDGVNMQWEGDGPQPRPIVIYAQRTLNAAQKQMLAEAVASTPPSSHGAVPACIFEGRHAIQFYAGGKLRSSMEVCFQCPQIQWEPGDKAPIPDALNDTLKKVVAKVGLTPERDWHRYAIEHGRN